MSNVVLEHVYKVYEGGVRAVNDFCLDIQDKEFVVFVGPSGCGKSTTLRMIAGLEDITAGKLWIDGEVVNEVDPKNRDIAMVFQSYALYPHMTVFENMAFGLKLRHVPKEEIAARVSAAAEILEITDLLTRKPKALSGGQRQRVALGRAIVREPKVFLLDEPLSNLDAKLRVQMRSEITKLHEKLATTFIYVTHDQTEAMTMGSRIVVMKDGFVQQVDTPMSLFEDPCNLFVATFLGSPQMNVIDVDLVEEEGILYARLPESEIKIAFPEIKKNELASKSYIGKRVKLGIRPDGISLGEEGLAAEIEVVEQLGTETILYTKLEGRDEQIVVKLPFLGHVASHVVTNLVLNMGKAHLFDPESGKSIMGIPNENKIPCRVEGSALKIGSQKIVLSNEDKARLLDAAYGENVSLAFKPEDVLTDEIGECYAIQGKVAFVDPKTDFDAVFFTMDGVDGFHAFKVPSGKAPKGNVTLYLPKGKFVLYGEDGNRANSREEILSNETICTVSKKDGLMKIRFGKNKLVYPDDPTISEGEHTIRIKQTGAQFLYTDKMVRKEKVVNPVTPKENRVKVSCYDEDPLGTTNVVYVKIDGFEDYVSLVLPNVFSVYKMPEFQIHLPYEAIEIR